MLARFFVVLLLVVSAIRPTVSLAGDGPSELDLARLPDDARLTELLWSHSPDVVAARAKLAGAEADLVRAGLLPNPTLDGSWNTIPVGQTTPSGLDDRLDRIPNYAVSLSMLLEIAKRGPRQHAARSARQAAALDTYELLRQRGYDLLERIADVAATQVRIAALGDLAGDARRLTDLQRARASHGDTPGVDTDRAALEAQKYAGTLRDEQQKLGDALVACGRVAGVACRAFGDAAQASAFLARAVAVDAASFDARPDIRSLAAQSESAQASLELARNKRIPDPTFRLGYVYDQFVLAGNQRNSLFAGVSVPLPVFDHGQADAMAAAASSDAASRAAGLLRAQAERDADALGAQARAVEERRRVLQDTTLPLARQVVDTLEKTLARGGTSLVDLLLARRSLGELLLDDADTRLTAFHLAVARGRNGSGGLPAPPDLAAGL